MQPENRSFQLSDLKQPLSLKEYCIDAIITKLDDISENTLAILPTELKDEIYFTLHTNVEQKFYPLTVDSEKINISKMIQPYPININDLIKMDDNKIALGLDDNTIRIMQLMPFQELAVLNGHTGPVTALAKIDNNTIASGSADTTINIWDLEKKQVINQLTGLTQKVEKLVKINNETIASTAPDKPQTPFSDEQALSIWNIKSGATIKTMSSQRNQQIIRLNDHRIAYSNGPNLEIDDLNGNTKKAIYLFPTMITSLERLNAHTVAAIEWGGDFAIYDMNTIQKLRTGLICHNALQKIDVDTLIVYALDKFYFKIWDIRNSMVLVDLSGKIGSSMKFKKCGNFFVSYESTIRQDAQAASERRNTLFLWDLRPLLLKYYTLPMLQKAYRLLCKEKSTKEECINAMAKMFDELDKQSALKSSK